MQELEQLFRDSRVTRCRISDLKRSSTPGSRTSRPVSMSRILEAHHLNDRDARDIITKLGRLLDSPEEIIQMYCLRTLRWFLWASKDDKFVNEKDQDLMLQCVVPKALRMLSESQDKQLRGAASSLILALSEWESFYGKEFVKSLGIDVRTRMCAVLRQDIERLRWEQMHISDSLEKKRLLLNTLMARGPDQKFTNRKNLRGQSSVHNPLAPNGGINIATRQHQRNYQDKLKTAKTTASGGLLEAIVDPETNKYPDADDKASAKVHNPLTSKDPQS
mmetsp:Transcript_5469/g.7609  ORF Transcript_5469/g.7609 Transcript_5469/m.7609 type:complete len:276 (+) Transcript_5469:187-1014(+)